MLLQPLLCETIHQEAKWKAKMGGKSWSFRLLLHRINNPLLNRSIKINLQQNKVAT
jgi:hypothetical protein